MTLTDQRRGRRHGDDPKVAGNNYIACRDSIGWAGCQNFMGMSRLYCPKTTEIPHLTQFSRFELPVQFADFVRDCEEYGVRPANLPNAQRLRHP